jgi:uncharacterized membrane protein YdcZ (DUF606 family)
MPLRSHYKKMRPASWIDSIVGICCLLVALWLVPMLLLDFFQLDPFIRRGFAVIMQYTSFVTGSLLLGSVGVGLLTGKYRKNRKIFHRIWLVMGGFAIISFLMTWASVSTVP